MLPPALRVSHFGNSAAEAALVADPLSPVDEPEEASGDFSVGVASSIAGPVGQPLQRLGMRCRLVTEAFESEVHF